jgi:ATP-dependent RNA helicase RhlE
LTIATQTPTTQTPTTQTSSPNIPASAHPEIAAFADLTLTAPLMQAVKEAGYERPTPIQARAIPHLLQGRDLLGLAQTGTGKTAAFVLPLLQRLMETRKRAQPKSMRALILTPTRELAVQIVDSLKTYGKHLPIRSTQIFGGVGQNPQVDVMRKGIDVVVATPGRLLDLISQGHVKLESVETFVLDEADRMLDMGFIRDIRRITPLLPKQRQTLLFSATMPNDVADLAKGLLSNPVRVEVAPQSSTAERIEQRVYHVARGHKRALLAKLLGDAAMSRAIVFTRTKHGANRLAEQLEKDGFGTAAIHGNKSQGARQQALNAFKNGKVKVLVATDIAARGIDVDGISHVVNYELPMEPEAYVHRIGRTARAGATGIALSLCDHEERGLLRDIERIIRLKVPVVEDHPFVGLADDPAQHADRGERRHLARRGGGGSVGQAARRRNAEHGASRDGNGGKRDSQPKSAHGHNGHAHSGRGHNGHNSHAQNGHAHNGHENGGRSRNAHAHNGNGGSGGKPSHGKPHRGKPHRRGQPQGGHRGQGAQGGR